MFDELKNSWKNQDAKAAPSVEVILNSIREEKNKMLLKLLFGILSLSLVLVVFWLVWFFIPFKYLMTKVAILCMSIVVAVAVGYLIYLRSQMPKHEGAAQQSKAYLQQWIKYQEKLKRYLGLFITGYMLVLIIAMGFYLYEVTESSMWLRIIAYVSTGCWFLYCWFVLNPRWIKKSDEKIQGIIDHYKKILEQM